MREAYRRLVAVLSSQSDVGLLLFRVWVGAVMANHGYGKVTGLSGFIEGVGKMFPLPQVLGPFAAFSEFFGGLLIAIGLLTRPAAAALTITMVSAAVVVHGADPFGKKELALGYAAAGLLLLFVGPGRFSLDKKLFGAA